MFDERTKGIGIIFVGDVIPGQPIKYAVKGGESVVLHRNGESILVRGVETLGDSRFKGIIYGFELSHSLEHQGLKVDDVVEFEEQHIISCSDA